MNSRSFHSLEKVISISRLSSYRSSYNYINRICKIPKNNKELVTNYVLNAKLSENFYFLLQNLEVCLRNAIYDSFNIKFPGQDFFFLNNSDTSSGHNYTRTNEFHAYSCWKMIGKVKYEFRRRGVVVTDGKIISELNFGFWTKLLEETHYTPLIWRRIFKEVFPHYPHGPQIDLDVRIVVTKIDNIRKFRNRIFHYEPIFNHPDLMNMRDNILETIGWINIDMMALSKLFDESDLLQFEKKEIRKSLNRLYNSSKGKHSLRKIVKKRGKSKK